MKVLGIDILAGSPESKTTPRYSVALLEDGELTLKDEAASHKLRHLIAELKPDRIACDNIYELFSKDGMRAFFLSLPRSTKVIQVNGRPERMEPLHLVARRNGLRLGSRSASMEEAIACAKLAGMNVGYEVRAFHDRSLITVSRARGIGRGGQSQNRYRRKVHNMVAANVKGIAEILDERGVVYKLSTVNADSGLSRGVFEISSSSEGLAGIRQQRGPDVQVKIRPVLREKLEFVPLQSERKSVIFGVDPGITVGLAVIDLDGNLLEVFSARDFSLSAILNFATKYSDIAVIASDVTPAPKLVERIGASLDAVVFTPSHSLNVEEKLNLIDERFTRDVYSNAHERDAVAAAIKAHNSYRNKLLHLEKRLQEMGLAHMRTKVRRLVLRGTSLDSAIQQLTEVKAEPPEIEVREVITDEHRGIIRTLREEIALLRSAKDSIAGELEEYKSRGKSLERRLREVTGDESRKLRKDHELRLKEKEIIDLRNALLKEKRARGDLEAALNKLIKARLMELSDKLVVVKVLKNFTREDVLALRDKFGEGEFLFILDAGGGGRAAAEEVVKLKPAALIADLGRMSHMAREYLKVPVISPGRLEIKLLGEVALVDRDALWAEIDKEKKRLTAEEGARMGVWLEEYVEKYRGERKR